MEFRNAIKKVVALGAGTAMLGATLMGAMAADLKSYPDPFVKAGKFDAFIVVGDSAASSDVIGAVDIAAALQYSMKQTVTTAATGKVSMENAAKIETGSSALHYGDPLSSDFTGGVKSSITSSDLPLLLKGGSVTDKNGTTFKYTTKVDVGNMGVAFGKSTPETDRPVLYLDMSATSKVYNITIDFPTAIYMGAAGGKAIDIFGKEFTVSDTAGEVTNTAGSEKITFYTSAIDQTFSAGETSTVNVGGSDVTIEVIGVNTQATTATATVKVNGESATVTQGLTTTIGGQKVYVKDIFAYTQPVGGGGVRLFIGTNKLVFEHGQAVATGSGGTDSIDGTKTIITAADGKITRLSIEVTPYSMYPQNKVLKSGGGFTDPVFGAFKFQFTGADEALDASTKSYIKVLPSAEDKLRMEFTAKTGVKYAMDFIKGDSSNNDLNLTSGDYRIHVNNSESMYPNEYFVIGSGEYQHVLRLASVQNSSTTKEIRVKEAGDGGSTQSWSFSATDYTGSMSYDGNSYSFTATADSSDASNSYITMTSGVTNAIYLNNDALLTFFEHNVAGNVSAAGGIHIINLTEKTSYTGGSPHDYGSIFVNVTYSNGRTGNDVYLPGSPLYQSTYSQGSASTSASMSSVDLVGNSGYDYEALTPFGTFIKYNSDTSSTTKLELYSPVLQTTFGVFLAPTASTVSTTAGTTSVTIEKIQVGAAKLASEVIDNYANYNLIVVGGPCANAVASKLMGNPANCAAGFEEGKATVKLYEQSSGKVAMLVAGMTALDTRRASKAVADGKLSALPSAAKEASIVTVTDAPEVKVVSS